METSVSYSGTSLVGHCARFQSVPINVSNYGGLLYYKFTAPWHQDA